MESVRLRLVFEKNISKAKNFGEMKRCWVLLKPQYKTISDFSLHILNLFDLHNACPNGLLLSMDGFTLPSFESTSILKNEDIIRVERIKDGEIVKVDEGVNCLQVMQIMENPPASNGTSLLVNKEFDNEAGGYETESEEIKPVSKKRKKSKEVQSSDSKKEKSKSVKAKKRKVDSEDVENNDHAIEDGVEKSKSVKAKKRKVDSEDVENNDHAIEDGTPRAAGTEGRSKDKSVKVSSKRRSSCHKEKDQECGPSRNPERCVKGVGLFSVYRDCLNKSTNARSHEPQGNGNALESSCGTQSGEKKLPSRSARRKKAKRQWLREIRNMENKDKQLLEKFNQQSGNENQSKSEGPSEKLNPKASEAPAPEKDENKPKEDHEQPGPDSDADDDIVPIVIRPGHIRFKPLSEDADQNTEKNQISVDNFQWNGITSKKRGQKWGMEKAATNKKNDSRSWNQECSRRSDVQEETPVNDHIDFDKLAPYTTLPKVGDVIAYRLIELSSSWTPELSPYRVGKISRYDMETNMMLLLPVPGYPIPAEKVDGETSNVASETTYREDGSLQIKFSVLIDVRLVKRGILSLEKSDTGGVKEVTVQNQDARSNYWSENKNEAPAAAPTQANGALSVWDEINQALDAKKTQLTGEDNWNRAESSGTKPWSFRALRGSAMGPTMAWLRSQKEL